MEGRRLNRVWRSAEFRGPSWRWWGLTCLEVPTLPIWHLCAGIKAGRALTGTFLTWSASAWKSAFERQWSPGKLFVDHITSVVLRLSGLRGIRNSFGEQINSSFSWQLGSEWEWERKEVEEKGKMNEGGKQKNEAFDWNLFNLLWLLQNPSSFLSWICNNSYVTLYVSALFQTNTTWRRTDFVCALLSFFFTTLLFRNVSTVTRKLPSPRVPIISCFILSGHCCRNNALPLQACFAYLFWTNLN